VRSATSEKSRECGSGLVVTTASFRATALRRDRLAAVGSSPKQTAVRCCVPRHGMVSCCIRRRLITSRQGDSAPETATCAPTGSGAAHNLATIRRDQGDEWRCLTLWFESGAHQLPRSWA